jgi:trehalose/maltose hydrolase-like predicted phosphorylase
LLGCAGVMPPDEDNHGVDNNPYTNIGAGYAIFFAKYAECLCAGEMESIPQEWLNIAKSLALIYDPEHDYHPEFEGYNFGTPIKQADVVLVGFPQLYDMPASTRRNDLLIYENVTRDDGPAMTWAMHTVGFLELDDTQYAEEIFNKSYQSYMRQPYKIWTEARPPTLGAINFITGMGGFLQSIVSGYGGYRLFPEKIVFQKPRVPPQSTGMKIKGCIKFRLYTG